MALIECPDCHSMVSDEAPACPKCGRPIAQVDPNAPMEETVVYQESPAMFRNRPFSFLLCVLLIPVLVGLIILFIWWLVCRNIRLTITDKRTELRTGLLSKHTIELRHDDIRSVVVRQSLVQLLTPDHLRGRGTSGNQIFVGSSNEIGSLRAGLMAALFGPVAAAVWGGLGTLAVVGVVAAALPALRRLAPLHTLRPEE